MMEIIKNITCVRIEDASGVGFFRSNNRGFVFFQLYNMALRHNSMPTLTEERQYGYEQLFCAYYDLAHMNSFIFNEELQILAKHGFYPYKIWLRYGLVTNHQVFFEKRNIRKKVICP